MIIHRQHPVWDAGSQFIFIFADAMFCGDIIFLFVHTDMHDVAIKNIASSMLSMASRLCESLVLFADDFVMTGEND